MKLYDSLSLIATQRCVTSPTVIPVTLSSFTYWYNISATVTDPAGNASGRSPMVYLLKDTTASNSAPGVPTLDSLYDSGASSTDYITRETQPKFIVECLSGYTVKLYDASTTLIGSGPCVANTAQIIPTLALSAGVHSISATQTSAT